MNNIRKASGYKQLPINILSRTIKSSIKSELISRKLQTLISSTSIHRLQPGLVLIKGGLSSAEQVELANIAFDKNASKTFWKTNQQGDKVLNSTKYRGRVYGALASSPQIMAELVKRSIEQAVNADQTLRPVEATHYIQLFYKTLFEHPPAGYIPWHQDNGENDGDEDFPVVSFSVGDSCNFLVNNAKPKLGHNHPLSNPQNLAHRILFESGDVLVFGGSSRKIWHSIHEIFKNSGPKFLPFNGGRLNFTFRHTPKLAGDEKRFDTVGADKLPKDSQFYKLSRMGIKD